MGKDKYISQKMSWGKSGKRSITCEDLERNNVEVNRTLTDKDQEVSFFLFLVPKSRKLPKKKAGNLDQSKYKIP